MSSTSERTTTPADEFTCRWDNMTASSSGIMLRDPSRCLHVECWHTMYGAFIDVTIVHEARGCINASQALSFKNKTYHFFPRMTPIDEALEICEKINGTLAVPDNREQELELGELGAEGFGEDTPH
ncbi:hypothetical protein FJT64_014349 [Amphibalanus amphitrite]|uniref:Uncharacterized protein n=1 Tax=Amphibalanus amphitrite TaxID=1232801 RepID=A0A6A4UZE1_AMPAM|nr:hypothetical protein FJT64_014349 [Amphibalanus amphitrite]